MWTFVWLWSVGLHHLEAEAFYHVSILSIIGSYYAEVNATYLISECSSTKTHESHATP